MTYFARARATDASGLAAAEWSDWLEFTVVSSASADVPTFSLWADEYTQDALGFAIHTTRPSLHLAPTIRRASHLCRPTSSTSRSSDADSGSTAVTQHFTPTRDGLRSQADWVVAANTLEVGHRYTFRYRIAAPSVGQWETGPTARVLATSVGLGSVGVAAASITRDSDGDAHWNVDADVDDFIGEGAVCPGQDCRLVLRARVADGSTQVLDLTSGIAGQSAPRHFHLTR